MKFYYYPKCSTCRKAKKWLESHNIFFEAFDIREERPSKEVFLNWFLNSDYDSKKFFNTSGVLYREKNYKEKLKLMNEEERADLLSKNGMLIKRPLLVSENKVFLGFKEKEYENLLEGK